MASYGLIGNFSIKKIELYLRAVFIFFFASHLETSQLSYQGSVNDKPHLQSIEAP